ncbi:MAG: leucine-rich repeat domain-containing protein, partial [Acutalibacteraceae bacterium]
GTPYFETLTDEFVIAGDGILLRYNGDETTVRIPAGVKYIAGFGEAAAEVVLPDGVTGIADYAFRYSGLTGITLPESLRSIGKNAFYECEALQSVTLNEGIEEIGDSAFFCCTRLAEIQLPESLTKIGENAFNSCSSLQALHLPENVRAPGTAFATMCASLKTVSLPGVTVLPKDAFAYCTELETVSFGECLASIGKYAFLDCAALRSIQIPIGTQEIRVGAYAFCDCKALEEIVLPDTVSLSSRASSGDARV